MLHVIRNLLHIHACSSMITNILHTFNLLPFYYPPPPVPAQVVNITTSGSPVAGQNYSLTCTGAFVWNTSIIATTTWKNATGGIPGGIGITVSRGTLTFNPLRTSHGGQYICMSTLSNPYNSTATGMKNIIVQCMYQWHIYI